MGGAFFVSNDILALVLEGVRLLVECYLFCRRTIFIDSVVACFDITDIGCDCVLTSLLTKFQQTGRFTVSAADIQHQLIVNVDPHIIVTGEEELNGDFIFGIIPYLNLTVIGQCKVKLQLRTKAVVVLGCTTIANALVEREETKCTVRIVVVFTVF